MNAITNPRNEYWNGSTSWLMEANRRNNGYDFTGLLDDSASAVSKPFSEQVISILMQKY